MLRTPPVSLMLLALLTGAARADVGATALLQSDARDRGVSYSADRPAVQLGLAWDGAGGWYAGASLAQARFERGRGSGWLRVYGGRVVELRPGLDAEAGMVAHRYERSARYDHVEGYVGVLGERWNLRLHHAPDHEGSGQRSVYGEANLRWPLADRVAAVGHAGVLRSRGDARWPSPRYIGHHGPTRFDLRVGAAWQLGEHAELQLAWVHVSRGGPVMWTASSRRSVGVLGLSLAL